MSGRRKVGLGLVALVVLGLGMAGVWRWTAWAPRLGLKSPGFNYPLAFSGDGATLATCASSGIILWDPKDGRKVAEWPSPDGRKWSHGKFSPDGRTFAAITSDPSTPRRSQIDLIEVATGRVARSVRWPQAMCQDYAFLDEGRTLRVVASDPTSTAFLDFDVATGSSGPSRPVSHPWTRPGRCALSEDGSVLAFVDTGPAAVPGPIGVIVWDLDRDRRISAMTAPGPVGGPWSPIALSRDKATLAIVRGDGMVEVRDVATGRLDHLWPAHGPGYRSNRLWLSPDGTRLISNGHFFMREPSFAMLHFLSRRLLGDPDPQLGEVAVVDLADGRRVGRAGGEGAASVISPDGRTLATSSEIAHTQLRDLPAPR